jgi:hypothetical protein
LLTLKMGNLASGLRTSSRYSLLHSINLYVPANPPPRVGKTPSSNLLNPRSHKPLSPSPPHMPN